MKKYLIALFILFFAVSAQAAIKTVKPGGGGDATSISGGVEAAADGDTIVIDAGTYNENVHVRKSLAFRSASGDSDVIVNGTGTSGFFGSAFRCATASKTITFTDIEIRPYEAGIGVYCTNGQNLTFTDCTFATPTTPSRLLNTSTDGIVSLTFNNCLFDVTHNCSADAGSCVSIVHTPAGVSPDIIFNGCTINILGTNYGAFFKRTIDGETTVTNCSIRTARTWMDTGGTFYSTNGSLTFIGNTVTSPNADNTGSVIHMTTGRKGYYICNNTFNSTSTTRTAIITDAGATAQTTDHKRISGNKVLYAHPTGFVFNIGGEIAPAGAHTHCDDVIVEKNFIKYIGEQGDTMTNHIIFFAGSDRGLIRHNYIEEPAGYGILVKGGLLASASVYGNIVVSNGTKAIAHLLAKGTNGVNFTNNTCIVESGSTIVSGLLTIAENTSKYDTNTRVYNNIFVYDVDSVAPVVGVQTGSSVGFDADNNLYYGAGAVAANNDWSYAGTAVTFAQWQANGIDAAAHLTDPLFVDSTRGILGAGSPAIDGGSDSAVPTDRRILHPLSRYDMLEIYDIAPDNEIGAVKYIGGSAWALTPVLDTGDPDERVCNPKSYTDLGNGIVIDNVTGLEWVQDGNPIYTYAPGFDGDGISGDGAVYWQTALNYVAGMNAGTYENYGYTDWRLPTVEELSTIVDAGRYMPAIDPILSTSNTEYYLPYWSSTPWSLGPDGNVWSVSLLYNGQVHESSKFPGVGYVRAVRGGPYGSYESFVVNGDGTVTVPSTGLIWQHCNAGQTWSGTECIGSAVSMDRNQAVEFVQELNTTSYLGYDDWRLPTRNELQSIVDYSRVPQLVLPNTMPVYLTSTMVASIYNRVWYIDFRDGSVTNDPSAYSQYFRAVRGGPCRSNGDWCIEDSDCGDSVFCNGIELCDNRTCAAGSDPCQEGHYCDEDNDTCAACQENSHCDDDVFCNGPESCIEGVCEPSSDPCADNAAYPFCDEPNERCVECVSNADCDDDLFCTGTETCVSGECVRGTAPCSGATPVCDETGDRCVECLADSQCDDYCVANICVECRNNADCSDGQFCTGAETCIAGECASGIDPCNGATPECNEAADSCVECLNDTHCPPGYRCGSNVCFARDSLQITRATVKAGKARGADSIKFSGTMNANAADVNAAMGGTITLIIEAAGIPDLDETTFTFPINAMTFKKGKYKSPKVKPVNKTDPVVGLAFGTKKGKLSFTAKNLNLTGLACPITVKIQFGDYAAEVILTEAVVNRTKPCPLL